MIFEGQVDSPNRNNLIYDDVERQYHVIAILTASMAKNYMCKGCKKTGGRDVTHGCDL